MWKYENVLKVNKWVLLISCVIETLKKRTIPKASSYNSIRAK